MGQIFLEGVTETLWPYVQALPDLAAAYPRPFSPDDAAAAHHHLFAFNLFPYESIFLDSSGLLGGDVTQAVAQVYHENGFAVDAAAISPDHLGYELLYLAHLTAAEAADQSEHAVRWQQSQQHFLENHLLHWLIPFAIALEQGQDPFYAQLSQLTLALAAEHYAALGGPEPVTLLAFILPDQPPALDEAKTGLRQISHYLLTPRSGGFYLTRQEIEKMGRALGLPRGFGKREEMLRNVWDAAAQYEQLPGLLQLLLAHGQQWQDAYLAVRAAYPALEPFCQTWHTRLHQTGQWLAILSNMVLANQDETPVSPL